jgi:hypothetical protein
MRDKAGKVNQISEDWCRGIDRHTYRQNVLQAMRIAQNRYRRRRLELTGVSQSNDKFKYLFKEYQELVGGSEKTDKFHPDNVVSIEKNYRRSIIKNSKCMGSKLERFFDIADQDNFAYYTKPKDVKPKKNLEMQKFKVETQYKEIMNQTDLKTWDDDKDKNTHIRLQIGIMQKKDKYRNVYFYSSEQFEIDYLKLQIEYKLLLALRPYIHEANMIFKTNVSYKIKDQILAAPIRLNNFSCIAAVCETLPNAFAASMAQFGQRLIDKAKSQLAPKNKWLFHTKELEYVVKDGKEYGKGFKNGKILFTDNGMQFIDDSNPKFGFVVDDYDSLHCMRCTREKNLYMISLSGRKMKARSGDIKTVHDPMEKLKLSKANYSNLSPKDLLIITIKNIELGKYGDIKRGDEICVRIQ